MEWFNIGRHSLWKWDCCPKPYLPLAITGVNEIHNPRFASVLEALVQMAFLLSAKPLISRLFNGKGFVMFVRLLLA
jgi:hypothetical protein